MEYGEDSEELEDHPDRDPWVALCEECFRSLSNDKVPPGSLVRVDTGRFPTKADIEKVMGHQDQPGWDIDTFKLEPLTMVEERLLGLQQASRLVTVMRSSGGDASLQQWTWKGHVIAFQNVDIEELSQCFSVNIDEISTRMQARTLVVGRVLGLLVRVARKSF